MRPKIPDSLVERIRAVYEDAGYATESEFIRDAIRRQLSRVEETQSKDPVKHTYDFEYHLDSVTDGAKYPTVYLRPEGSRVYNPGTEENRRVLDTGVKEVSEGSINDSLETLSVVYEASLAERATDLADDDEGWIQIILSSETVDEIGVETAVSEVLDAVADTLENADAWESPEDRLESVIEQYTSD
jgi:hypothetical protein